MDAKIYIVMIEGISVGYKSRYRGISDSLELTYDLRIAEVFININTSAVAKATYRRRVGNPKTDSCYSRKADVNR